MKSNQCNSAGCGATIAPASTTIAALVFGLIASSAVAGPGDLSSCTGLTALSIPAIMVNGVSTTTTITAATYVAPTSTLPGYCRVLATSSPQTDTEVRLPDNWAHRYLHFGGGGFDGNIPNLAGPAMSAGINPLTLGMVLVGSNGGHRSSGGNFFANPVLAFNYASGAIQESDAVAKILVQTYYGQPAAYRYFDGCSNGGKNASVAMAVFGNDYDGVVSGDGVYGHSAENTGGSDMPGLTASWALNQQRPTLSAAKGTLIRNAQFAACDAADGLADGVIANPEACHFDPAVLRCTGAPDNTCLTDTEIATVNGIRGDTLDANGRVIGPPYGLGDPSQAASSTSGLAGGFLSMAFGVANFDPKTFTIAQHWPTTMHVLDDVYGMSGSLAGIADYLNQGRKLMVYHGWDDMLVQPYVSVRLYQHLQQMAPNGASNARVYMFPGMGHCTGGNGATSADLLGGIINWVENGIAPDDALVASRSNITRPLCAYPKYYRYAQGDPNSASSFSCVYPSSGVQGDVNYDGVVNCKDALLAKAAIGKRTGQLGFLPTADLNNNGVIDASDVNGILALLPPGPACHR